MADGGPLMTPFADVPNWPGVGAPKAVASNQRLTVCWSPLKLASRRALGLMVTWAGVRLPEKAVHVES